MFKFNLIEERRWLRVWRSEEVNTWKKVQTQGLNKEDSARERCIELLRNMDPGIGSMEIYYGDQLDHKGIDWMIVNRHTGFQQIIQFKTALASLGLDSDKGFNMDKLIWRLEKYMKVEAMLVFDSLDLDLLDKVCEILPSKYKEFMLDNCIEFEDYLVNLKIQIEKLST